MNTSKMTIDCSNPSQFDCTNNDCQSWCVQQHGISNETCDQIIDAFFRGSTIYYHPLTEVDIHDLIDDIDCSQFYILINATTSKDGYMSLDIAQGGEKSFISKYSIALFNGIFNIYPDATYFNFYKAVNGGTLTITFKVYDAQHNRLYNADLSGLPLVFLPKKTLKK